MTEEKTAYDPAAIEKRWYEHWESQGYFDGAAAQGTAAEDAYCIVIPPPNVTGSLHMGHAFQDTIMDALTRYERMRGKTTLWQPGTDHAGIATQMVVERQLAADGKTRHDLGRDAFIDRIWDWKAESGGTISKQLRRMGTSVDWSRERFTMDEGLSKAVGEVFVRLYEEDLIYRGKRLVNWDPVLLTAISDLEVESAEEKGYLWHFRYPLADGSGHLVVATTRPETMLGDSAVAVHPEDERYQDLIGKTIKLPLTDREIPIIADDYVDQEFGTGCVKITPAHDFNDYAMGQRHDLPIINVMTPQAAMNENVPEAYRGLDRYEARKQIVADLDALDLLEKIDDHKLMVPRGDRSGTVVEPYLTDQWFVRAGPLAEPAIKAVENGDIRFVPDNWKNTYFQWMRNIEDWCISRQIWWGHQVPAWYDADGNVYVARSEAEAREKHGLGADVALTQDSDVLDTWFSSALWPFSTLGWPENTEEMKAYYPTSVLVTGFDIIFFWVARMVMMGMKFAGDVPFKDVYVTGLIRDGEGNKMSKSKGNVLDPLDLIDGIDLEALVAKRTSGMMQPKKAKKIEKATRKEFPKGIAAHGTDAVRFTFAALASTGRDIRFDMNRAEGYRNFCNKLWNATRFALMNLEDFDPNAEQTAQPSAADLWIESRLKATTVTVAEAFAGYRFDLAAAALYEFTWHEFCDWYLELSKPAFRSEESGRRQAAQAALAKNLEALLRLLHPIMPFITEELWQKLRGYTATKQPDTIMLAAYPQESDYLDDSNAVAQIEWLKTFILGLRQIRGEMDISPGKALPVILADAGLQDRENIKRFSAELDALGKIESIEFKDTDLPEAATALLGSMKILVPLAGVIDVEAERERLNKQIAKLTTEQERLTQKLANPNYAEKAPEAVVQKDRDRLAEVSKAEVELKSQLERLATLA